MNKFRREVGKAKFEGIPNAYILVSGHFADQEANRPFKAYMSFLYHNPELGTAAEWEPRYGPIQVWHECGPEDENAREHYFLDFVNDGGLNWSQLAVDRHRLQEAFNRGYFRHIFAVLKDWSEP